jgi:hypothetical protein
MSSQCSAGIRPVAATCFADQFSRLVSKSSNQAVRAISNTILNQLFCQRIQVASSRDNVPNWITDLPLLQESPLVGCPLQNLSNLLSDLISGICWKSGAADPLQYSLARSSERI